MFVGCHGHHHLELDCSHHNHDGHVGDGVDHRHDGSRAVHDQHVRQRVDADSVAGGLEGTVADTSGCSMSQNSVEGYEAGGGTNMWTFRLPYGGGTIGRWNDAISGRGDYWGGFDKALDLDPNTSVIWWNLCTVKGSPQDSFENAVKILDQIENRIPGVEVYVSAQPPYADGHICALAGDGGPELMEQLAQQLIDAGLGGARTWAP